MMDLLLMQSYRRKTTKTCLSILILKKYTISIRLKLFMAYFIQNQIFHAFTKKTR